MESRFAFIKCLSKCNGIANLICKIATRWRKSSIPSINQLTTWPIFFVSFLLVLQFGLINILQVRGHVRLYPVVPGAFGCDAVVFLGWKSFFSDLAVQDACQFNARLTHPPFFKQLLSLLPTARHPDELNRMFWGNVLCVFVSATLASLLFLPAKRLSVAMAIFATAFLSYPVLMLLARGNIDGWVGLFVLSAVFGISRNKHAIAGLFIAFAFASKIYPVVLLAPLILQFQLRALLWSGGFAALIVLSAPHAWDCFVSNTLSFRVALATSFENGSLLHTIAWLYKTHFGDPNMLRTYKVVGTSVVALNFILDLLSNRKKMKPRDRAAWLLLYLPVMLAFPNTVFHYGLWSLILLPVAYAYLLSRTRAVILGFPIFLCCIGVALSQFPVVSFIRLQEASPELPGGNWWGVPGLGSLILLIGHVLVKYLWLWQMPAKDTLVSTSEPSQVSV